MALLSSDQMTQIRAQASESLDRTCTLRTIALGASDAAGGFSTDTTGDTTVSCRIAPPTGRDRIIAERLGLEMDTVITLPHGTTAAVTSDVLDATTGERYQVVSANPQQSWRTATRVYARRLA